jgi:hypothetical protein
VAGALNGQLNLEESGTSRHHSRHHCSHHRACTGG